MNVRTVPIGVDVWVEARAHIGMQAVNTHDGLDMVAMIYVGISNDVSF